MSGHILVDGNAVAHAYHRAMRLTVGEFETQAIFGVTKAMRDLITRYPERRLIVLWDGKAKWRFEIHPEYKGNRKPKTAQELKKKESYKAQIPLLQGMLQRLGVMQLLNFDLEADDLAGYITGWCSTPTLLVTGDRDWCQLIRPGVTWFDPRSERMITADNFFEQTGYKTPHAFVEGKALMGDGSDNIDGVGGIGEKGAPEFIALYGCVDKFRKRCETVGTTGVKKAHLKLTTDEGYAHFQRNMKLMNLLAVPKPAFAAYKQMQPSLDLEVVRAMCQRLAFITILKDFTNFTSPFVASAAARGIKPAEVTC